MTRTVAAAAVDLRTREAAEATAGVLEAFDALPVGETLEVHAADAAPTLLRALQGRRKGLFEWSLLEAGPERFRIGIHRRAARPGQLRGVAEALAWDHGRLDALEGEVFDRLAAGDGRGARAVWRAFTVGVCRHIRCEEEIIFPAYEKSGGAGPTGAMRFEHREIEAVIEAIGNTLANPPAARMLRRQLHEVLGLHNLKEEEVVYPTLDRTLGPDARDALVARVQAVS